MVATSTVIRVRSNDRDVREFRLLVDYGFAEPGESSPVVVVWNELWLYGRISEAVRLAIEASSEYMTAEADLLDCVNPVSLSYGTRPLFVIRRHPQRLHPGHVGPRGGVRRA